jgi:hypothetical protein
MKGSRWVKQRNEWVAVGEAEEQMRMSGLQLDLTLKVVGRIS